MPWVEKSSLFLGSDNNCLNISFSDQDWPPALPS